MSATASISADRANWMPSASQFVVDDRYLTNPLGIRGGNALFQNTGILNIPDCVCIECGGRNKMSVKWVLVGEVQNHFDNGYRVIPEECWKNDFNGNKPMVATSPSRRFKDGACVRESGMAESIAMWTVCSNKARIDRLKAEAFQAQMDGRPSANRGAVNQDNSTVEDSNALRNRGITPEDDVHMSDGGKRRPLQISVPGLSPG